MFGSIASEPGSVNVTARVSSGVFYSFLPQTRNIQKNNSYSICPNLWPLVILEVFLCQSCGWLVTNYGWTSIKVIRTAPALKPHKDLAANWLINGFLSKWSIQILIFFLNSSTDYIELFVVWSYATNHRVMRNMLVALLRLEGSINPRTFHQGMRDSHVSVLG